MEREKIFADPLPDKELIPKIHTCNIIAKTKQKNKQKVV